MKKKNLIFALCIIVSCNGFTKKSHLSLLKKAGLSQIQSKRLDNILEELAKTDTYLLITAAKSVANELEKERDLKANIYKKAHQEDKGPLGLSLKIISLQKDHLADFARITSHYLPPSKHLLGFLKNLWGRILACIHKAIGKNKITTTEHIANQLLWYTKIERIQCLHSYKRAMHYFVFQSHVKMPEIVDFWSYKPTQYALTKQIKKYGAQKPIIQASAALSIVKTVGVTTLKQSLNIIDKALGKGAAKAGGANFVKSPEGKVVACEIPGEGTTTLAPRIAEGAAEGAEPVLPELSAQFITYLEKRGAATQAVKGESAVEGPLATAEALRKPGIKPSEQANIVNKEMADAGVPAPKNEPLLAPKTSAAEDGAQAGQAAEKGAPEAATPSERIAAFSSMKDELVETQLKITKAQSIRKGLVGSELAKAEADVLKTSAEKAAQRTALRAVNKKAKHLKTVINREIKLKEADLKTLEKGSPKYIATTQNIDNLKQLKIDMKTDLGPAMAASEQTFKESMLTMAADMMLQMSIMSGASLAISWIEEERGIEFTKIRSEQALQAGEFKNNIIAIQAATEHALNLIELNASAKLADLQAQQETLSSILSTQQTFLMQSLVNSSIADNYVADPMTWDQYFFYAPMFTPSLSTATKGLIVKNTPYTAAPQTFYRGYWTLSPVLKTKNLADTIIWQFINGKRITTPAGAAVKTLPQITKAPENFPTNTVDHTWYNITRKGNWGYSALINSFFQYQAYPNSSPQFPQGGDAQEAALNYIFTEYIPPCVLDTNGMPTYQIQAEVQVNSTQYPWVAGIIFNGGRWISGATDQMNQYRFCGLYGTKNPQPSISLCAAETFFITTTTSDSKSLPITPIAQIMATPDQAKLWNNVGQSLVQNPLYPANGEASQMQLTSGQTYIITILTQPEQITITLQQKNTDGTTPIIFGPSVIINRNPLLFKGHSVGFISSGCSTRFCLLQPEQLVYTTTDIALFNKQSPGATS